VATNIGIQGLAVFLYLVYVLLNTFRKAHHHFQGQVLTLRRHFLGRGISQSFRRKLTAHLQDLRFMMATCKAMGGFIFIRLTLGLFGMDLYEVYWWFGGGMAICLLNLVHSTARKSTQLLELCPTEFGHLQQSPIKS
jgi:hypothetical protein